MNQWVSYQLVDGALRKRTTPAGDHDADFWRKTWSKPGNRWHLIIDRPDFLVVVATEKHNTPGIFEIMVRKEVA